MSRIKESNEQLTQIAKALYDEHRQSIIALLRDGEKCACELIEKTGMAQSTLSFHMKALVDSGLVNVRNDGKWRHYSISHEGVEHAHALLDTLFFEGG